MVLLYMLTSSEVPDLEHALQAELSSAHSALAKATMKAFLERYQAIDLIVGNKLLQDVYTLTTYIHLSQGPGRLFAEKVHTAVAVGADGCPLLKIKDMPAMNSALRAVLEHAEQMGPTPCKGPGTESGESLADLATAFNLISPQCCRMPQVV